ncbi:hypothetical protein SKA53_07821 [Yoonia vestfoldensis SKA53]|uniref:Uncharacterized protein n=1 Tax=Yoonia vestfoldensis SKA53 TaxID=314232 RepID=A3V6Y0_9RHOB|nr:hypothetical protein SKA53_07821 [Yoonia vestfoldensis SKA53]
MRSDCVPAVCLNMLPWLRSLIVSRRFVMMRLRVTLRLYGARLTGWQYELLVQNGVQRDLPRNPFCR